MIDTPHVELKNPVTYQMTSNDNFLEVVKVFDDGTFLNNKKIICNFSIVNLSDLSTVLERLLSNEEEDDETA